MRSGASSPNAYSTTSTASSSAAAGAAGAAHDAIRCAAHPKRSSVADGQSGRERRRRRVSRQLVRRRLRARVCPSRGRCVRQSRPPAQLAAAGRSGASLPCQLSLSRRAPSAALRGCSSRGRSAAALVAGRARFHCGPCCMPPVPHGGAAGSGAFAAAAVCVIAVVALRLGSSPVAPGNTKSVPWWRPS